MRTADKVAINCCGASSIGRSITEAWLVKDAALVIINDRGTESNDLGIDMGYAGYFVAKARK